MFEGIRLLAKCVGALALGFALAGGAEAKKPSRPDLKGEAQAFADRKCLAEAMYFEAGFEGEAGMIAVAEVVLRRAKTPGFPKTICKVVYEDTFDRVCQFSFACDGARVRPGPGRLGSRPGRYPCAC